MTRFLFRTAAAASLLLAIIGGAVLASTAAADEIATCAISAWSNDTDVDGLNVRSGAGTDTAVIGHIPMGGEMSIIGSKDGWFRIDHAELTDYESDVITEVFAGEGWVSGRLLGLLLNDANLHTAPSVESPVVARLFHEDADGNVAGADSFIVTRLLACQGSWVQVEGTFIDTHLTGWATRTCSNQVTTCP